MTERVEGRRSELEVSWDSIHRPNSEKLTNPHCRNEKKESKKSSHKWSEEDEYECLGPTREDYYLNSTICERSTEIPSEESMRGARWESEPPGNQIPTDSSEESSKDNHWGDKGDIDHSFSNRLCNRSSDDKYSNKVKECCPEHCHTWRENSSSNDGSNWICWVVHPIGKIEDKGNEYDKSYKRIVRDDINDMREEFHRRKCEVWRWKFEE